MPWFLLILGLVLLYFGAEWLVKGGAGLALRLGLTPLVVGLTVMAYGTSSPEAVVSVNASFQGNGPIALGNVVGSNICNIGLILGLCAMITPMTANAQVIRREIPIMIVTSIVFTVMVWNDVLGRFEGAALLVGAVVYTWTTVRAARAETSGAGDEFIGELGKKPPALGLSVGLVTVGLVVLIAGAQAFVTGAVEIAESFGVRPVVIGLTVVAIGTSLPELATSLVAALKKQGDVAVGNIVGSNLFNLLGVIGLAAVIRPVGTSGLQTVDLAVMLGLALVLLPLARTGGRINRWEGALFFATFVAYTTWLVMTQAT